MGFFNDEQKDECILRENKIRNLKILYLLLQQYILKTKVHKLGGIPMTLYYMYYTHNIITFYEYEKTFDLLKEYGFKNSPPSNDHYTEEIEKILELIVSLT